MASTHGPIFPDIKVEDRLGYQVEDESELRG